MQLDEALHLSHVGKYTIALVRINSARHDLETILNYSTDWIDEPDDAVRRFKSERFEPAFTGNDEDAYELSEALQLSSKILSALGRWEEADTDARRAAALLAEIARRTGPLFLLDHSVSHITLAERQLDLESLRGADGVLDFAGELSKGASAARRDCDRLQTFVVFHNTLLQSEIEQYRSQMNQALASAHEADMQVRKSRMLLRIPGAEAEVLDRLARIESWIGSYAVAEQYSDTAVVMWKSLYHDDPHAYAHKYGHALVNHAGIIGALGAFEEARTKVREGLVMLRQAESRDPNADQPGLAEALYTAGMIAWAVKKQDDAFRCIQDAIEIVRTLAVRVPNRFLPNFAEWTRREARWLLKLRRPQEAVLKARTAVDALLAPAEQNPRALFPSLFRASWTLADCLVRAGQREMAQHYYAEASKQKTFYEDLLRKGEHRDDTSRAQWQSISRMTELSTMFESQG